MLAVKEDSRMVIVRFMVVAVLSLLCASVLAAPKVYEVSASIKQNGKAVATPTVLVKPNTEAEMTVAGENGYRLSVIVSPAESGAVDVSINVGTSQASLKTAVTTLTDKPIALSGGNLEVSVTVSDSDS